MEGGTDALADAGEAVEPLELDPIELYDDDVAVIRATQGPCRWSPSPTRRPPRLGITQDERAARSSSAARARRAAPRRGDPLPPPRRLLAPTAWASGRCPRSEILEIGPRMAAFRGISHCYQRPTYADWPYSVFTMAHGRSKEECDAILDAIAEATGISERATLYSATEFKKIRLLYFTDDFKRLGAGARGRLSPRRLRVPHSLTDTRSAELYARAVRVLPGGVNSPVRAMRSIGRDPIFVDRAAGRRADRRRRQPLRRLRLLVGPADPRPRASRRSSRRSHAAAARGTTLRRADRRARSSSPRRSPRAHAVASRCCA